MASGLSAAFLASDYEEVQGIMVGTHTAKQARYGAGQNRAASTLCFCLPMYYRFGSSEPDPVSEAKRYANFNMEAINGIWNSSSLARISGILFHG